MQPAMNAVDLASLLCSRLCHDLMSPVGALNNGIELMADEQDPEMRERCVELLADSAKATANKLKFFRLAFGAGGGFGDLIDANEGRIALEGIFGAERRIELGWMVADDKLSKGAMKLLLNLALIVGDALVPVGRLDIGAGQPATDLRLRSVARDHGSCWTQSSEISSTARRRRPDRTRAPEHGWPRRWRRKPAHHSAFRACTRNTDHRSDRSPTGLTAHYTCCAISLARGRDRAPMDDLISEFHCRMPRDARGARREIVAWEAPPDDRARLDSIFRFVHTVKGNCGFFSISRARGA